MKKKKDFQKQQNGNILWTAVFLIFLFLAGLIGIFVFIPTNANSSKSSNGTSGILIFGRSGDSLTMDPSHATDGETFYATTQLYNTLVQFEYGTINIEPGLAKSWKISKNGLEYIFYLRKGVFFHQTSYFKEKVEFTADDVIFSLKRQMDPKMDYHKIGGTFKYWMTMNMSKIIQDIVKVDSYTVKILLKRREAPFLSNLAMNFASILCSKYAQKLWIAKRADDLSRYPIGTGPFIFVKWIKDDQIFFKSNPDYWEGAPKLKGLVLKVITNKSVRAAALRAGEIHIMDFPNPEEVAGLEKLDYIKVLRQEGLNVGYLAMNMDKKPFDNQMVRKAIYYGIQKKEIVKAIFAGLGKPAKNPLPPTIWSYDKEFQDYEYNPKKAKELLKKAGYPNGFSTNIWAMPVTRPYMPDARKLAEAIQGDLSKIGIKIKIVSYDWGTYLAKTSQGEHSMAILGWTGDNGDPDNFLYVLLSSHSAKKPAQNISFFRNKKFDDLLMKAKVSSNVAERTKLYLEAQKIFHEQVPWVPLAHSIVVAPMSVKVEGFKLDPVGSRRFHKVSLKP